MSIVNAGRSARAHDVPALAAFLAGAAWAVAGLSATVTFGELLVLRRSRDDTPIDRRRPMRDPGDAPTVAIEGAPATLAFVDLDGFEGYNEAFGEAAGDALLRRLGRALARAVAGSGAAYGLGGDGFCVLLDDDAACDDGVVRRGAATLSEDGEAYGVRASYYLVRLPEGAQAEAVARRLGERRRHDGERDRRGRPRCQARDVLLRVLRERKPELDEHVNRVATLAVAVGRELALTEEQLDELAYGAELHDLGKVVVPDTILGKPTPLDEREWRVVRQHTIVGERILAAAPALRSASRLVRASHERWDGRGYPDGLRGETIPLGARIISVCDAFHAMRQKRPYAPSMPEADALAELHRCAGTQFDRRVVEAFAVVLARGAGVERSGAI